MAKKDVKNLFDEIFDSEDIFFTFEDGEEIGPDDDDEELDIELKDMAMLAKMKDIQKYHTKTKG